MERVIAKHRPIHLQNNHLLSDMQHMFTHTCTILFESMNDWTISVQSKTGISAAYIHFSRAFDRAIHVQLLQWRRNYGDRGSKLTLYPQVQDLYPLYETVPPPSERCGLCQNFKQTISTTRLYKVRTNLYSPLTKTFRRAWLFARLHNYGIQDFRATCCGGSEFFT